MKKIKQSLLYLFVLISVVVFGQNKVGEASVTPKFGVAVGAALGFQSGIGLYIRPSYEVNNNVKIGVDLIYYGKKSSSLFSYWEANANVYYAFYAEDEIKIYGLVGANYLTEKYEYSTITYPSESKLGFNIGGGGEYWIKENLGLFLEAKYEGNSLQSQLVGYGGLIFRF